MKSYALPALTLFLAPSVFAHVPCIDVHLPGVYQSNLDGVVEIVRFTAVANFQNAYRIAKVTKSVDETFVEVGTGHFSKEFPYAMVALQADANLPDYCQLAWYKAIGGDFEYSNVVGVSAVGDINLGGDHYNDQTSWTPKNSEACLGK